MNDEPCRICDGDIAEEHEGHTCSEECAEDYRAACSDSNDEAWGARRIGGLP